MPFKSSYKKFVSQFTLPEWKLLCKHRLFLHFLKTNVKIAASIAAGALQRPILYSFPATGGEPKPIKKMKKDSSRGTPGSRWNHRRFRF